MRSWVMKAAAVAVLSRMPAAERITALTRRFVTRSVKLPERQALGKCERAAYHVQYFLEVNGLTALPDDFVALELGTGWFPAAPIAVSLLGASRVYTVDVSSHLTWRELERTLQVVGELARAHRFPGVRTERLARLDAALASRDVAHAFRLLGIERIVGDARAIRPERPVDLFFSNNTLEHIPELVLGEIFARFREIGSERAVMSHWIDMSDHFWGFDRRIGPYHFLRFDSSTFEWFNGDIHYQNRLRHSDFKRIHAAQGWHMALDVPTRGDPADLHRHPLASEFRRYTEEDLLVYEAWMVSAKRPVATPTVVRHEAQPARPRDAAESLSAAPPSQRV